MTPNPKRTVFVLVRSDWIYRDGPWDGDYAFLRGYATREEAEAAIPGQPLGRSVLGDKHSIGGITVDDLASWLEGQYPASSLLLVAAGKLDHDQLVDCAETAFGSMRRGDRPLAAAGHFGGGVRAELRLPCAS